VPIAFFMYSCPSVRLLEYISAAPTGRIYVEFDVGNFYETLPRCFKFGQNREKKSVTLLEDLTKFD
jgi:hypothetical protein